MTRHNPLSCLLSIINIVCLFPHHFINTRPPITCRSPICDAALICQISIMRNSTLFHAAYLFDFSLYRRFFLKIADRCRLFCVCPVNVIAALLMAIPASSALIWKTIREIDCKLSFITTIVNIFESMQSDLELWWREKQTHQTVKASHYRRLAAPNIAWSNFRNSLSAAH